MKFDGRWRGNGPAGTAPGTKAGRPRWNGARRPGHGPAAAAVFRRGRSAKGRDEWVGSRPCTADGLPLIGATRSSRVFAAGGHGMWAITPGPVTGPRRPERVDCTPPPGGNGACPRWPGAGPSARMRATASDPPRRGGAVPATARRRPGSVSRVPRGGCGR
ncbi:MULTISPECIES: FAD-dependent oxidoreductase [Streptomyces]|uniref:FAD-dependent oxidoreductase n=1 Tax=Streptomyces TaxID=1883 RepID=UPI0024820EC6|nr:FAD-dependent oxidoreductase [Streptomyces pini]